MPDEQQSGGGDQGGAGQPDGGDQGGAPQVSNNPSGDPGEIGLGTSIRSIPHGDYTRKALDPSGDPGPIPLTDLIEEERREPGP